MVLTAQIADSLQQEFEKFDVLHDHRQKDIDLPGKRGEIMIVVWN